VLAGSGICECKHSKSNCDDGEQKHHQACDASARATLDVRWRALLFAARARDDANGFFLVDNVNTFDIKG
jgi:hypothetical protein